MKSRIKAFEQIEGRSVDVRRLYNDHINNLAMYALRGGAKMGQGLEKCVYDSNKGLTCTDSPIAPLPPTKVNIVLSEEAFREEMKLKHALELVLDPKVMEMAFITMDNELVCRNIQIPADCTSEVRNSTENVLARSNRGSTSDRFESKHEFGKAVLNLVFGLYALHAHGFVHGDVKIHPRAHNVVRFNNLYKLIDLGMVMSFVHFKRGLEKHTSSNAQELQNMQTYSYWPVGHLYVSANRADLKKVCKKYSIPWKRLLMRYFENIDVYGLMQSLRVVAECNPHLKLKPLLVQLQATPEDFQSEQELRIRKIVWASSNSVLRTMKHQPTKMEHMQEMFLGLDQMYTRIRTFCGVQEVPPTIQEYYDFVHK